MFKLIFTLVIISIVFSLDPIFGDRENWGEIEFPVIDEASGIVASRKNKNVFWTHNDSGDKNRIYVFNNTGKHLGEYYLDDCNARDWEDIAMGPGPEDNYDYLYIGEIGDNLSIFNTKYIYRFIEPEININQSPVSQTINNIDIISFQYEDGNRDAETLIVDPLTKDIFILSKKEELIHIYTLPYPQSTDSILTAELVNLIDVYPNYDNSNVNRIAGGDISSDGMEILLKSYINIFHFPRYNNQTIGEAFNNTMTITQYIPEPQGEAVGWHPNNHGYFTISEENHGISTQLYFYPRTIGCMDKNATNYNPYAKIDKQSCKYKSDTKND